MMHLAAARVRCSLENDTCVFEKHNASLVGHRDLVVLTHRVEVVRLNKHFVCDEVRLPEALGVALAATCRCEAAQDLAAESSPQDRRTAEAVSRRSPSLYRATMREQEGVEHLERSP